jgi:hypothetical protein
VLSQPIFIWAAISGKNKFPIRLETTQTIAVDNESRRCIFLSHTQLTLSQNSLGFVFIVIIESGKWTQPFSSCARTRKANKTVGKGHEDVSQPVSCSPACVAWVVKKATCEPCWF